MTNPEAGYKKAQRQVEQIFRQFFPAGGLVTREGQIRLCHMMLDALFGQDVALCDACVLWQLQRPRQMQRPVVISTASVALQSAILEEYIPFLSDVLIQNGYIQKPICAVLRKGKERFACDRRLLIRQKQIGIRGERFRRRAAALRAANQCLDLDLLPEMPVSDKLTDIQSFLLSKKNPSYFEPRFTKEVDYYAGDLFHSGSQYRRSHHAAADSDLP